jgi:GNAT superfamily N-acetyltransferase
MVTMSYDGKSPSDFGNSFDKNAGSAHVGDLEIRCATLNQLSDTDIEQLDAVRTRALDSYERETGNVVERTPIREELQTLPSGLTTLDKLVLRAYYKDQLVAYAHVLCGWPHSTEWTIEQLILNPDFRLKGIGTKVVSAIEDLASHAEIRATAIISMPSRPGAESFWNHLGYESEDDGAGENGAAAGSSDAQAGAQAPSAGSNIKILHKSLY